MKLRGTPTRCALSLSSWNYDVICESFAAQLGAKVNSDRGLPGST